MGSLSSIVARAKLELGLSSSTYDAWLELRANDTMRALNITDTYVKKDIILNIDTNGRAQLPNDFYKLLLIRATCSSSVNPLTAFNQAQPFFYYLDLNFLSSCGINCNSQNGDSNFINQQGTYQINNGYVYFYGNFSAITSVAMCYLAWNVDDDGEFLVSDDVEEAVGYKLIYLFLLSRTNRQYTQYQLEEYKKLWLSAFNKIRGERAISSFRLNKPLILSYVNALLGNKNIAPLIG